MRNFKNRNIQWHRGQGILLALCVLFFAAGLVRGASFRSDWPEDVERVWAGHHYWTNPLQDWRLQEGWLRCTVAESDRETALLTHRVKEDGDGFTMEVRIRIRGGQGWAGFCVGAEGRLAQWSELADYRDNAVRGEGLHAGLTSDGTLFIGNPDHSGATSGVPTDSPVVLRLESDFGGNGGNLTLRAMSADKDEELASVDANKKRDAFTGAVKLMADQAKCDFQAWSLSGNAVEGHEDRTFGPVLWSQYTLNEGTLNMTAQMPPMGAADDDTVRLQVRDNDSWKTVATSSIHDLARTATFRVTDWDGSRNVPYRVAYTYIGRGGSKVEDYWKGTVREKPTEQQTLEVAGFTCSMDYGWPNVDLVKNVKKVDPDFLFFSGDQVYEPVNNYGKQFSPLDKACLDYLRKWYFFGWAFRDLLKNRPSVIIPDDHDVYQGNLFGASGKDLESSNWADGGYFMPPKWVNMVERTQTSHLPDPVDPEPVKQGIGVYFTDLNYGGVSFAVIEDRKFKTGPNGVVPGVSGNAVKDPDWNPETADVDSAQLLGERQLNFLSNWAADWSNADMKMALSQTVFACASTHIGPTKDRYVVADLDTNGWPQTGRNKAVSRLRKAFAFHLCGDQHLATLVHHGINDWGDANWSMAVPAVANIWERHWRPKEPGIPVAAGTSPYLGKFYDGFNHPLIVRAITNPSKSGKEPEWLYDAKPGWGLVKVDKDKQEFTVECWPRWADPAGPDSGQFAGWPKTIPMQDNYGREAEGYLPTIEISGMTDPVVQVIHESRDEIVYTRRVKGTSFQPRIFEPGSYTVRVGSQAEDNMKALTGLSPVAPGQEKTVEIVFRKSK